MAGQQLIGIFLLSSAMLALEIVASRVTSVIYAYNYAFMIVSLAILGLGCGGIFAFYKWQHKELNEPFKELSFYSSLFAATVSLYIILITEFALFADNKFLYFIILSVPFFFAGVALSLAFRAFAKESFRLYAADLLGAAAGSILSLWMLNIIGGVKGVLFIGALGAVSSFFLAGGKKLLSLKIQAVLSFVCALLFFASILFPFLKEVPIAEDPNKDLYGMLTEPGSSVESMESKWSAFGRTDLVAFKGDNSVMHLFVDGAAGTAMYGFDGDLRKADRLAAALTMGFSGGIPFLSLKKYETDSMLVIGPGGGREILLGLLGGVKDITGVEVNPDFVNIVKEYRDYNGGIYTDFKNVNMVVNEGRSFVRGSDKKYDIIMITIPLTKTSRTLEGFALTENYLFTVESVREYLDHLTDEGRMIGVFHHAPETLRFIMTSLTALREEGVKHQDAMNCFYVIGKGMNPVVVLKKKPFTYEEIENSYKIMQMLKGDDVYYSYMPYDAQLKEYAAKQAAAAAPPAVLAQEAQAAQTPPPMDHSKMDHAKMGHTQAPATPPMDHSKMDHSKMGHSMDMGPDTALFNMTMADLLGEKPDLDKIIGRMRIDISPAKDDKPFFFKHQKGLTAEVLFILFIAVSACALVIILPAIFIKLNMKIANSIVLFMLLGAGFMLIEISFFQKLTLFLGSPTVSLAVLLGSLLSGMGAGSFYGSKLFNDNIKRIKAAAFLIFVSIIAIFFIHNFVLNAFLANSVIIKCIISASFLIPLGFLLGIPFPTAINLMDEDGLERFIPWMYGINGIASVLGLVGAIAISLTHGFSVCLIVGALCYLVIDLIL